MDWRLGADVAFIESHHQPSLPRAWHPAVPSTALLAAHPLPCNTLFPTEHPQFIFSPFQKALGNLTLIRIVPEYSRAIDGMISSYLAGIV